MHWQHHRNSTGNAAAVAQAVAWLPCASDGATEDAGGAFCGRSEGAPPGLQSLRSKSSQCDLSPLGANCQPLHKSFSP